MSTTDTPEPAVGQVWADCYPGSAGRTIRIDSVDSRYAYVTVLTNSDNAQRDLDNGNAWRLDTRGRKSRILRTRLRPIRSGYRYVRTEEAPDA